MIREVTYYQAVCDACGYTNDEGEYAAWSSDGGALDDALASDWIELGNVLLCERHVGKGWCSTCEDDLNENGWTRGGGELIQTCSQGHLNTIHLNEWADRKEADQ